MTAVISIRHDRSVLGEPDVVRIDRATRWGNPFVIGRDGPHAEVIEKYRAWLWREIRAGRVPLEDLAALHGRRLACWCAPEACHGDVLAAAAGWAAIDSRDRRAAPPSSMPRFSPPCKIDSGRIPCGTALSCCASSRAAPVSTPSGLRSLARRGACPPAPRTRCLAQGARRAPLITDNVQRDTRARLLNRCAVRCRGPSG